MKPNEISVLLVDDRPENLLALEAMLGDMGHRLVRANSGLDALRSLLKEEFAVILLDVQMPGMDGFETAKLIRERESSKHTPIIFLTASISTEEMVLKGYSLGAVDYLIKPLVPEILRAKVRIFVELWQRRAELLQANVELQRSNADLAQFAYVASHDLREPLRAVSGSVQLIQEQCRGKFDAQTDELAKHAVDGTARMQALITDLLEYSRAGTQGLEPRPTDFEAVVAATLANLEVAVQESGAEITRDPLPTLVVDTAQLHQLFQNLVGNALKFHAEQPPRIHIGAKRTGKEWEFSVSDNGIGLERENAERIFLIFQRLHTRQKYPGTGIGLAICRKIVERHGGRIWVESEAGKGSTFRFTFPVQE